MAQRRITAESGEEAWGKWLYAQASAPATQQLSRQDVATAVRYTLQSLAEQVPGSSVEVRVVPYGAVQIISGSNHRRGTPPAVVEMSPNTWLRLASGLQSWEDAVEGGEVDASGERANLSPYLPLSR